MTVGSVEARRRRPIVAVVGEMGKGNIGGDKGPEALKARAVDVLAFFLGRRRLCRLYE
jgi:hypothetical protein